MCYSLTHVNFVCTFSKAHPYRVVRRRSASSRDMLTISDIYKDDLPDDAIFVLEYPSSHKDNIGNPMFLVNSSRYVVSNDQRDSAELMVHSHARYRYVVGWDGLCW